MYFEILEHGEVTEDTKSREYLISVNIEEWEKK